MAEQEEIARQLSNELTAMRQRIGDLEAASAECRQVESGLRSEIERLRVFERVVEDSPDGFSVVDRSYVYRTVNRLYLELHGRPVEQIVGHTVADLLGETVFQDIVRPYLDRCFAGEVVRYESWFTFVAGGRRYMEIHYYPLHKDGKVEFAVVATHDITDRKQAEEARATLVEAQALRDSEERFRLIVSNSPDVIFYLDRDFRYIWIANPTPPFTKEYVLGKTDFDLFGREEAQHLREMYRQALETGASTRAEVRLVIGGVEHYREVTYTPRRDQEGHIVGLYGYAHDITERKQVEKALRESEERLRTILDNAPVAIYLKDAKSRFTMVNPESAQILGTTPETAVGKTDLDLYPDRAIAERMILDDRQVMKSGRTMTFEEPAPRPDGLHTFVSVKFPLRDSTGRIYGVCGISTDITERKRAEAERERLLADLQRRAAELDTTIKSIADGVVIYNPAGEIVLMNAAAEKVLGFTLAERELLLAQRMALLRAETVEGKPLAPQEHPVYRALHGETVTGVLIVAHRPRKNYWVSVSAAPIRAPDGTLLGAVSVTTDISELHELQEWLQDLIRTISHDLRNPLMVIQGQAQLLLRRLVKAGLTGAESRSAEAINTSTKRMNAMIQDLVESARLESGQLRLEKRPVDLKAFIADLLDRTKGVLDVGRIEVEMPADLPSVPADPDRLERIFVNLLGNALKYSPPETAVVIGAQSTDAEMIVSITDCGVGIAPEDLPHIFERFYQPKGGRKAGGLGLGLYISKILVEAHGGRIWAESAPGRGSTFYFSLPIA